MSCADISPLGCFVYLPVINPEISFSILFGLLLLQLASTHSHGLMIHLPHGVFSSLLSPRGLSPDPKPQEQKPHLPLLCPAIGCRHLYSTNSFILRSRVTYHHLEFVRISSFLRQPDLGGEYLTIHYIIITLIISKRSNLIIHILHMCFTTNYLRPWKLTMSKP